MQLANKPRKKRLTREQIRKEILDNARDSDVITEYFQRMQYNMDPLTGEKWEGDDSKISYVFTWLAKEAAKAEDEYEHTSFDTFTEADWEQYRVEKVPAIEANLMLALDGYLRGEMPYSKAREMMEVQKHMLASRYQQVITDKLTELDNTENGTGHVQIGITYGGAT